MSKKAFTPLSNTDIVDKLKKHNINIRFIPYHELKDVKKIDDLLPCILLYELHHPIGHWVALWRNKDGINYFDSTGHVPDGLLDTFENPYGRKAMGADYTYLLKLLSDKAPIIYNEVKLQRDGTVTCGAWCAVRLLCGDVSCDDFNEMFMDIAPKDREAKIEALYYTF